MQDLVTRIAIEELKAKYCRLLDTKQWDAWRKLFTDDFLGRYELPPHPPSEFATADELVATNRSILSEAPTTHHCHSAEITLLNEHAATGIWAMFDRVMLPSFGFEGYGYYHDEYRRESDGVWRIAGTRLVRTQVNYLDNQ